MKKLMLCALAILLALVAAVPASAQSRRSHRSDGYYGYQDGYHGTALRAVTRRNMEMISGITEELRHGHRGRYDRRNEHRDYYRGSRDYRYNRGLSRNEAVGAGLIIGGGMIASAVSNRRYNDDGTEEPSKCVERTIKAFRRARVQFDPDRVQARCSGVSPEPQGYQDGERTVNRERAPEEAVFQNCTRGRVFVGDPETGEGFYLNSGERGNAAVSSPAYGNFDGAFGQARIVWQGNVALITAPEGD